MHNPRQSRINSTSRTVLISPTNRDWDLQAITRRMGPIRLAAAASPASVNAKGPVTHTQPLNAVDAPRFHPLAAIVQRVQNCMAQHHGGWLALWIVQRYRDRTELRNRSVLSAQIHHSMWLNYATNCRNCGRLLLDRVWLMCKHCMTIVDIFDE